MKEVTMEAWVLTVDQRDSRHGDDAVPQLIDALTGTLPLPGPLRDDPPGGADRDLPESLTAPRWVLPPERTAGDEVQALTDDPPTLVAALWHLAGRPWWVGLGFGPVETPLPNSTRAATGAAYLAARSALDRAKQHHAGICSQLGEARAALRLTVAAETLAGCAADLSPRARDVADLYDRAMTTSQAADALGISGSAVSQRLSRAHWGQLVRLRQLVADLAADLLAADHRTGRTNQ